MQTRRAHHELARKSPAGTLPPSPCGLRRTSRFAHFRHLLVLPPSFRAAATAAEPGTHNHDREYGSRLALRAPRNDHGFVERSVQTQLLALAAHHARVCPGEFIALIEQGRREGRALAAAEVGVQKSTRSSPQV